jgi:hypothetical protein
VTLLDVPDAYKAAMRGFVELDPVANAPPELPHFMELQR